MLTISELNSLKHNATSVKCGADTPKKMMNTNEMVQMVDQNMSVIPIFPIFCWLIEGKLLENP
jgi:hypothetical protein